MKTSTRSPWIVGLVCLAACHGKGGGGGTNPGTPPSNLAYPHNPSIYVVDLAGEDNVPSVAGVASSFSIQPALPAGLVFDTTTGSIHGTPAQVRARSLYTVRASNAAGSTSFALDLTVSAAPRFAYAVSSIDSMINVFSVDAASGRLNPLALVAPPAGSAGAERIYVHPAENHVYVPNATTQNISVYAIDPATGWLTPRASAAVGDGPHRLAFTPDGAIALVASRAANELAVFGVDESSGELSELRAPLATGPHPCDLAIDRTGRFVFLTLAGNDVTGAGAGLQSYAIDALTHALTPVGAPLSLAGQQPTAVRIDPFRSSLYVTLGASDSVLRVPFDATSGALQATTAYLAGDLPAGLAVDPLGRFAFVFNSASSDISTFSVDASSGLLTSVASTPVGAQPAAAVVDTAGRFLYVVEDGSNQLVQYGVTSSTGALAAQNTLGLRAQTVDLAFVRGAHATRISTRFAHVVNSGSADVSAYTIPAVSGLPSATTPTSDAGLDPVALAVHPRLPYAYVADRAGQALKVDRVDPTNGALTSNGPIVALNGNPWSLAIEPSGRFLYVARRNVVSTDDGWLSTYAIDASNGALDFVNEFQLPPKPTFVGVEPLGRWVYVATIGGNSTIQAFAIDPMNGTATISSPPSPAPGVVSLGFHPNGRWLYSVLRTSNTMIQYSIDPLTGEAVLIPGGSRAGREPLNMSITPDGRFAYVAYNDSLSLESGGHIALFSIGAAGELLTPATRFLEGLHTTCVTVDAGGRFLYATNAGTNDLATLSIDPATGFLVPLTPVATGLDPRVVVTTAAIE